MDGQNLVEVAMSLSSGAHRLSDEQKALIYLLAKECELLGAKNDQMAPIYAGLFVGK